MRIERISVRGRMARTVRLLASLCVVAAFAYAVPPAAAASSPQFDVHELAAVSAAVDRSGVAGIAWYVDAASDRVVVTADRSVSAAELATIKRSAGAGTGAIQIKHATGVFAPLVSPGDAIYGGGYRCSLGFNVVQGSTYYFLTAGHCGKVAKTWYTNASHTTLIGPTSDWSFPGNDYALVRYGNLSLSHPGGFTVRQRVRRRIRHARRLDDRRPHRQGHRAQRHRPLCRRWHRPRDDPDQRLRRAGRLRWPALRRH